MGFVLSCHLLLAIPIWISLQFLSIEGCGIESCADHYMTKVSETDVEPGSNYNYCVLLKRYLTCVTEQAPSCRGNLNFHTTRSLVAQWTAKYNCSSVLSASPPRSYKDGSKLGSQTRQGGRDHKHNRQRHKHRGPAPSNMAALQACLPSIPHTDNDMSYCALFGDPHLIRYDGRVETCRMARAWPLIDNPYLAVQVTSEAVVPTNTYYATAITQVTVIVKGNYPCAEEKTYEARTGHLPTTFVDGSTSAGTSVDERSVLIRRRRSTHERRASSSDTVVEIRLRYARTVVSVRLLPGTKYLSVAVRIPQRLILSTPKPDSYVWSPDAPQAPSPQSLELCAHGCPANERVDLPNFFHKASAARARKSAETPFRATLTQATTLCTNARVVGAFFDACVFDLLNTGDAALARSSYDAQTDYARASTLDQQPPFLARDISSVLSPLNDTSHHHPKGKKLKHKVSSEPRLTSATASSADNAQNKSSCLIVMSLLVYSVILHRL